MKRVLLFLALQTFLLGLSSSPTIAQDPATRFDAFGDPLPKFAIARFGSTRFRYPTFLRSLRYTNDGKLLTAFSGDEFFVWDADSGKVLHKKVLASNAVAIRRSDTQMLVAANATSPTVQWDIGQSNELPDVLKIDVDQRDFGDDEPFGGGMAMGMGIGGPVAASQGIQKLLVAAPDGDTIAVTDYLGASPAIVRWMQIEPGKPLDEFKELQKWRVPFQVLQMVFAEDQSRLVIAGQNYVMLCGLLGRQWIRRISLPQGIRHIRISPDATRVAFQHDDQITIQTLSSEKSVRKQIPASESELGALVWSPDGKRLFGGGKSKVIWSWDVGGTPQAKQVAQQNRWVDELAVSPDGKTVASGDFRRIRLFDCDTGKTLNEPKGHEQAVLDVDVFQTGQYAVSAGYDGRTVLWSTTTGKEMAQLSSSAPGSRGCCFAPDGRHVALIDGESVRFVNLVDKETRWEKSFTDSETLIRSLGISADGRRLAAIRGDTVFAWDTKTGDRLFTKRFPQDIPRAVALSPQGRLLAYASSRTSAASTTIVIHDFQTHQDIRTLKPEKGNADSMTFSADGRKLLVSGHSAARGLVDKRRDVSSKDHEDSVILWNLPSSKPIRKFGWSECMEFGRVTADAVFSQKGKYIFTAEYSGQILVYDAATGVQVSVLNGHANRVQALAISRDGKRLVSGSDDGTALVWDVDEMQTRLDSPTQAGE